MVFAGAALAQRTTGELRGTVYDASGAVVPNASVTVANQDTGQSSQQAADARGEFTFPLLQPGNYKVQVAAPGFKKYTRQDVPLRSLETATVQVKLEVGGATEEVVVQAQTEQVNVSSGGVAQRLNKEMIAEFPNLNRYGFSNASLLPGVNQYEERRETLDASVAGAATDRNSFYIDGAEATDPWRGWSPRQPVADAFDEIVVSTAGSTPDTGANFGGTYNAVLKSGTNTFHGGAWYYFREKSLNANTWSNNFSGVPKADDPDKYVGGQFGGPVVKDKVFFYVTVSRETDQQAMAQNNMYAPTPAMINGDFSGLSSLSNFTILQPNPNFDPSVSGSQRSLGAFPGNVIPSNKIDPVAKAFWDKYGYSIPAYGNTWNVDFANERKVWNLNGRVDFNISEKHRLAISGYWFDNKTTSPDARVVSISGFTGNSFLNSSGVGKSHWAELSDFPQTVLNLKHTWMIQPNLFVETHGAYSKMPEQVTMDASSLGTTLQTLGANDPLPRPDAPELLPSILIGNWWGSPETAVLFHGWTTDFTSKSLSLGSSMTWIKEQHNVKFGVEFQRGEYVNVKPAEDSTNGMNFDGGATSNSNAGNGGTGATFAHAFADFLLGRFNTYGEADHSSSDLSSWNIAGYIQDQWRATPRLTVTPSLRYDLNSGISEANNHLTIYRPGVQSTVFPNAPAGILVPGDPGLPDTLTGKLSAFEPRLNFAYDISGDGKTAIRGSIGHYYGRDSLGTWEQDGNGFTGKAPFTGASATTKFGVMSNPWLTGKGAGTSYSTVPVPFVDQNPSAFVWPPSISGYSGLDPNYHLGSSWQWNIAVERELMKGLRLEASYQGNTSNDSPTRIATDLAAWQSNATTDNIQARRPNQFLGDNGMELGNFGQAKYDQFLLIARINTSELHGQLSWTYINQRRNFGGTSQSVNRGWDANIINANFPDLLYSAYNNQSIGGYLVWNLPILKNDKSAFGKVLGGWALSTDGFWNFGRKDGTVYAGYDINADGYGSDLANVTSLTYPKTSLVGDNNKQMQWVAQSGVSLPGGGTVFTGQSNMFSSTVATSGLNAADLPSQWNVNATLMKNFKVTDTAKLQLRLETYNVFNHSWLNDPNLSVNSTEFGLIRGKTGAGAYGSGRRIQLAARVSF